MIALRLKMFVTITMASLFCSSSLLSQKKVVPSFVITGVVLNSRDNSPVLRCSLTATLVSFDRGSRREPIHADTDERGRFSLILPSAGNWELTASAHNMRSQPLDAHEGFFTGIILTPQSPSYEVIFHAVPDAIVKGVVTDEAGEAVRNAQIALFAVDVSAHQTGGSALQQRQGTQTDDLGRFEIAGLEPGGYMVQVQARPWYATPNLASTHPQPETSSSPDPSLDVVYPPTWYPGVTDASAAGVLAVHPGDTLQADFRLTPVPSAHLIVPSTGPPEPPPGRRDGNGDGAAMVFQGNPRLSVLLPNGGLQPVFGQFSRNARGDLDISGLAPGIYQIVMPGTQPESPGTASILRVQAGGSAQLSAALPETSVTIAVDGGTSAGPSQIVLEDTLTGQSFPQSDRPGGGRPPAPQRSSNRVAPPGVRGQNNPRTRGAGAPPPGSATRGSTRSSSAEEEITLQVPPGTYTVTVRSAPSIFVSGLTAKGASVIGRSIAISAAPVHLSVHLASGLASVDGTATSAGKPSVGAMVLLVPATLGDPAGVAVVRRDQTNSDGSFRLDGVTPGQYILLAIDHGWNVRWTDPAILKTYLMQGTPLDLHSDAVVTPRLTALAP